MHFTNIFALAATLAASVGAQSTTSSTTVSAPSSSATPFTGADGNATVVTNNPPGIIYTATLPTTPQLYGYKVKGEISATANPNGIGVAFQVNFSNLPKEGGPFLYHLHESPVPSDGNCTLTGAHLDPFIRGETPACESTLPQTCQVGDLSGKHGKITADPFAATYNDDFTSTLRGNGAFFGNRSFVIHFANKTRISCANFTLLASTVGGGGGGNNATPTGVAPTQFTGGVSKAAAPIMMMLVAGLFALVL